MDHPAQLFPVCILVAADEEQDGCHPDDDERNGADEDNRAVYLVADEFLPHIPVDQYPGQALVGALYEHGGIRSVEIGSLMFGKYDEQGKLIPAALELVRLAIPRRVYTQSHIDYVAEVIIEVFNKRTAIKGLKIIEEANHIIIAATGDPTLLHPYFTSQPIFNFLSKISKQVIATKTL